MIRIIETLQATTVCSIRAKHVSKNFYILTLFENDYSLTKVSISTKSNSNIKRSNICFKIGFFKIIFGKVKQNFDTFVLNIKTLIKCKYNGKMVEILN